MAAHPEDIDILYWVFGTHVFDYGTDLYKYDAGEDSLTTTHNDHHGVNSIVFSPASSSVMYLGLESVRGVF